MTKHYLYILLSIIVITSSCRKSDYLLPNEAEIINDNGAGTGTVTWTKDMDITLQGFVFVNANQTLTIEPGSVIKFKEGQGATASALIVARGGKIIANGTINEPIIFTSALDNLQGSLPKDTTGLWGGIIILGDAPLNTENGEAFIEGIPINEPRALFGGINTEDNSGSLSHISIRYAGTFLHEGNEINGLTLGGVGSKTSIEYIEVINSADDGIEVFGGNVNLKYIVSYNAHDDAFDFDYGYQGSIQYFLGIQEDNIGDHMIEGGGANHPTTSLPISKPIMANFTFIGNNTNHKASCLYFERSAAGMLFNSILTNQQNGVEIEYIDGKTDCFSKYKSDLLQIESNIFNEVANNISDSTFTMSGSSFPDEAKTEWANYFENGNNEIKDVGIGISDNKIKLMPNTATNNNLFDVSLFGLEITNFKGAFGTFDWTDQWCYYKTFYQE